MKQISIGLVVTLVSIMSVMASPAADNPSFEDMDPLNPVVPFHEWRMLGNGQVNGYQYDMYGTLLYNVHGVPGVAESVEMVNGHHVFQIDADTIPNNAKYKNGYVHFHPSAMQDEEQDGIEGYFLKHTAVTTGFEFPMGRMVDQQGIDFGFPNNYQII